MVSKRLVFKETSILAYGQLKEHLAPYGYMPVQFTPGIRRHNTRRTTFTLAVDDFGIKYLVKLTLSISSPPSKTNMNLPKIGQTTTSVLLSTGITTLVMSMFLCPNTSKKHAHRVSTCISQICSTCSASLIQACLWSKIPICQGQHFQTTQQDRHCPCSISLSDGTSLYYARAFDPSHYPLGSERNLAMSRPLKLLARPVITFWIISPPILMTIPLRTTF